MNITKFKTLDKEVKIILDKKQRFIKDLVTFATNSKANNKKGSKNGK